MTQADISQSVCEQCCLSSEIECIWGDDIRSTSFTIMVSRLKNVGNPKINWFFEISLIWKKYGPPFEKLSWVEIEMNWSFLANFLSLSRLLNGIFAKQFLSTLQEAIFHRV